MGVQFSLQQQKHCSHYWTQKYQSVILYLGLSVSFYLSYLSWLGFDIFKLPLWLYCFISLPILVSSYIPCMLVFNPTAFYPKYISTGRTNFWGIKKRNLTMQLVHCCLYCLSFAAMTCKFVFQFSIWTSHGATSSSNWASVLPKNYFMKT